MISNITIPNPCSQSWHQMTPADNGRQCDSCCKTVVDFTRMTNDEIIAYLTSNQGTCGKFDGHQLASINNTLRPTKPPKFNWKGFLVAASLTTFFAMGKAEAKVQPRKEWRPSMLKGNYESAVSDTIGLVTIKGKLIDNDDKWPLAGAMVRLKGTTTSVFTNVNGEFTMKVPLSATLVMNFIGYQPQEFDARKFTGTESQTICLRGQMMMLGEPAIAYRKPPLHKRVINKIKKLF